MTDRELKKLSRSQLLEMLLVQSREVARLREELAQAQLQLSSRQLKLEESGSIAEAALKLNGVFEAAQAAADQYLSSIAEASRGTQEHCRVLEEQTRRKCEEMTRTAQAEAESFWDAIWEKVHDPFLDSQSWQEILEILEEKPGDPGKVSL